MRQLAPRLLVALLCLPLLAIAACSPDSPSRPANSAATGDVPAFVTFPASTPAGVQRFVRRGWERQNNWNHVAIDISGDTLKLYGRRRGHGNYVLGSDLNALPTWTFTRTGTSGGTTTYRENGGTSELRCTLTATGSQSCLSYPGGYNVVFEVGV